MEPLIKNLESIGFKNFKKLSSKRLAVLVEGNRVDALEQIQKSLKGAKYDPTPTTASSVGLIHYNGFVILAKPKGKQGKLSAGVDNEHKLVNTINQHAKSGPVNLEFIAGSKKWYVMGAVKAVATGTSTANRAKSDISIFDSAGNEYFVSIKKKGAQIWESADSFWGLTAYKVIEKNIKKGLVSVEPHPKNKKAYKLTTEIAIKATSKEMKDVVFGNDLRPGKDAVIEATYSNASFRKKEGSKDVLQIKVDNIITSVSDVTGSHYPYFLIRNDITRRSIKNYPGLRVLAIYKSRINRNTLVVSR